MAKGKKGGNTKLFIGLGVLGAVGAYVAYKGLKVANAISNLEVSISGIKDISFDWSYPFTMSIPIVFDIQNPSNESATISKIFGTIIFGTDQLGTFTTSSDSTVSIKPQTKSQVTVTVTLSLERTFQLLKVTGSELKQKYSGLNAGVLNSIFKNFDIFNRLGGFDKLVSFITSGSDPAGIVNKIAPNVFNEAYRFNKDITINSTIVTEGGIEIPISKTVTI